MDLLTGEEISVMTAERPGSCEQHVPGRSLTVFSRFGGGNIAR